MGNPRVTPLLRPVRSSPASPAAPPIWNGHSYHGRMGIGQVLLIVGAILAALVVAALAAAAVAWSLLRRRLRVAPNVRSSAPSRWMASPERAARLHRRLRTATAHARLATARPGGELSDLADQLAAEAVAIERELVAAARAHRSVRRQVLREPERGVVAVERSAAAIAAAARATQRGVPGAPAGPGAAVAAIADRADHLRLAMSELDAVERGYPGAPHGAPLVPGVSSPSPAPPAPQAAPSPPADPVGPGAERAQT